MSVHISKNSELLFGKWLGYRKTHHRYMEPIGIGRVVSAKLLNKIGWKPFDSKAKCGMDGYSKIQYRKVGHTAKCIENDLHCLRVSADCWKTLNNFATCTTGDFIYTPNEVQILKDNYPEIFDLLKDLRK